MEEEEAEAVMGAMLMDLEHVLQTLLLGAVQVRIHFIIVMIGWTGLAPWEFEIPFPDSFTRHVLQTLIFGAVQVQDNHLAEM